jgi:hypothetical protein
LRAVTKLAFQLQINQVVDQNKAEFLKAVERDQVMAGQTNIDSETTWCAPTQQKFTEFMHEQVRRIERFRRHLCRHQRCEISPEYAVNLWIARGYAAAFRQRFEGRA